MKKVLLLVLPLAVAAVIGWAVLRKSEPPHVNFTHVKRQKLVSLLPTNGKVEPVEWQAVNASAAGLVAKVEVQEGQAVAAGAVLATVHNPALDSELQAAEAKVAEARAGLAALEDGGRPSDLTDIDNRIARAEFDQRRATAEHASLQRLVEKQAATKVELQAAADKIRQSELEIEGLKKSRTALVSKPDVSAATARLHDAEAAVQAVRQRAGDEVVRSPIGGAVYNLAARAGSYLKLGDAVANIGRLDRVRVRVYVDEPELGRVAVGQPVTIRWQALPGKEWSGVVDRKPTSIQPLGSRQVGEVVCVIENAGRELIPGTNVDAEIRTAVVDGALVIPREALRHDAGGDFVYTEKNGVLDRRPVKTGASSVSLVQMTAGLAEGDPVALPSDVVLKPGDRVTVGSPEGSQ